MPRRVSAQIQIWSNRSDTPISINVASPSSAYNLFVTNTDKIVIDNGDFHGQVDSWTTNGTLLGPVMFTASSCYGLFVDILNTIYCCLLHQTQVVSRSLDSNTNTLNIVAGIGCPGNSATMLYQPTGIYVHINLDLYVADSGNDRIQLFHPGQLSGVTVAGTGAPGSTSLHYPTGITLDADEYMFIVDSYNHRIIGSGPDGFRCIAGCSGEGNASNQLLVPFSLSFDSAGNMFVSDGQNHRIQKFLLLNNTCSKYSDVWITAP